MEEEEKSVPMEDIGEVEGVGDANNSRGEIEGEGSEDDGMEVKNEESNREGKADVVIELPNSSIECLGEVSDVKNEEHGEGGEIPDVNNMGEEIPDVNNMGEEENETSNPPPTTLQEPSQSPNQEDKTESLHSLDEGEREREREREGEREREEHIINQQPITSVEENSQNSNILQEEETKGEEEITNIQHIDLDQLNSKLLFYEGSPLPQHLELVKLGYYYNEQGQLRHVLTGMYIYIYIYII